MPLQRTYYGTKLSKLCKKNPATTIVRKRKDYCCVSEPDASYTCLAYQNFRDMPVCVMVTNPWCFVMTNKDTLDCLLDSSKILKESAEK
jgi:hypothetical protein